MSCGVGAPEVAGVCRVLRSEACGACGAETRPACFAGHMQHPALAAGNDEAAEEEQFSGGRRRIWIEARSSGGCGESHVGTGKTMIF